MMQFKYAMLLAVCLSLTFQTFAHTPMEMKPKIIRESEIQSKAVNVETARNNEQIIKILLDAEDTAGDFTMFSDVFTKKDSVVPLHGHRWHDEAFYIVSGSFEVIVGKDGKKEIAGPGTTVFVPRGALHAFKSLEDNSKVLVVYTPGGWERGYREGLELTPEQREDESFMNQFRDRYDTFYPQAE